MELIADIFLILGAFGAGFCYFALARRLSRAADLEAGIGTALDDLTDRVGDVARTLSTAQETASDLSVSLEILTRRAEKGSENFRQLLESAQDLSRVEPHPDLADSRKTPQDLPEFAHVSPDDRAQSVSFFRSARSDSQGKAA